MSSRCIKEIEVKCVEKRRIPSKHYVYMIDVAWSDGTSNTIYRRYSKLFDFQCSLLDQFPEEAGTKDPSRRIIPFLPGKIYLGRSHIRKVAEERLSSINEYCKALIHLPQYIASWKDLTEFFEITDEDINPPAEKMDKKTKASKISKPKLIEQYIAIADYNTDARGEICLREGMIVEVAEKTETGWWFVTVEDEQGWVPSTYLVREDGAEEEAPIRAKPGQEEKYICKETFTASGEDEISLDRGGTVDVLEKNLQGWWFVRYKEAEGWAPATYLAKPDTRKSTPTPIAQPTSFAVRNSQVQVVTDMSEISSYFKKTDNRDSNRDSSCIIGGAKPPPRANSLSKSGVRQSSRVPQRKEYVTVAFFDDHVGDGISFAEGEIVTVVDKNASGWWFVRIGDREGWAPSAYIQTKSQNDAGMHVDPEALYSNEDYVEEYEEVIFAEDVEPDHHKTGLYCDG